MACRDPAPEKLPHQNAPEAASKQSRIVVPCDQQQLIAGDEPNEPRIPASKSGAAVMPGDCGRNEYAGDSALHAAQPEVDIFQIGFEAFLITAQLLEHAAPEETSGTGRDRDARARLRRNGLAMACAP